jgi:hypothetical protein
MLHQDEGHTGVILHGTEQALAGEQAAGRGADTDDCETFR